VGDFLIKNLALRRGGSLGLKTAESLEAGTVEAPARTQGTPRGLAWTRFLAETERAYTDGMRAFLKKDLGVEAAIIDTQASYGGMPGPYRESFNDFVDMHAYWQHPSFPAGRGMGPIGRSATRPWSPTRAAATWPDWPFIAWRASLSRSANTTIPRPAITRGDVPHDRQLCRPAGLGWLFQFDWGGPDADARRITGYFSLQQHPAKLAFLPPWR